MLKSIQKLLPFNRDRDRSLLVFSSDGFSLAGAVVAPLNEDWTIAASAESPLTEPHACLVEVISKLAVSYGRLPPEAILLHAHAIPSVVELAIDNVDKLKVDKLQELIRWEMEGTYNETIPHGDIGWLLVVRGYLTETQRDDLMLMLEAENLERGGARPLRFGELAIREGYINREQFETCLSLQNQLQLQDQRILCGWDRLSEDQPSQWLVSAISVSIRDLWLDAFRQIGRGRIGRVNLLGIYPLIGCSAGVIRGIGRHGDAYMLELHQPYLALLHYRGGRLRHANLRACSRQTPGTRDILELLSSAAVPEEAVVYVYQASAMRRPLRDELKQVPGYDIRFLEREFAPIQDSGREQDIHFAIRHLGATHLYSDNRDDLLSLIPGFDAAPVWYKRPAYHAAAAVFLFAALVGLIEFHHALKQRQVNAQLEKTAKDTDIQEKLRDDARASLQMEKQLQDLKQQHTSLLELKKIMESILFTRQEFTQQFLEIIVSNISDNIILDSISETQWNRFQIDGWALEQASIDYFSTGLARDLDRWSMYISSSPSSLGQSQSGYSGYNFSFMIEKRLQAPETAGKDGQPMTENNL